MRIETVAIGSLRPYAGNARTHSKKQIRQIANSIKRFGFNNPILVDDGLGIIAGHGRLAAASLLGMKEVPIVRLSHLSADEKRAYILADNRLAEQAGWDRETLAIELQALENVEFDLELTGFEMPEADIIIDEARQSNGPSTGPEDAIPLYAAGPPVSQLGDMWVLGKHRLLCGDARDEDAYKVLLDGKKAQYAFTDPPYNVPIDGHVSGLGRIRHGDFAMACGEMNQAQFTEFLVAGFRLMAANTVDGSIHQICMDWRHMWEMLAAGNAVFTELKNLCVWKKTNAGMGSFYRSQHELVFVWKNGSAPHINNFELGQHGRTRSNIWDYEGVNTFKSNRRQELSMHPTVKPVALVADAIWDCSRRNDLVLDPFAGSGTILIAAERTGRRARGLEIDPHYVDVAVRRWQLYTGRDATLGATGETFEDVGDRRRTAVASAVSQLAPDPDCPDAPSLVAAGLPPDAPVACSMH
jgi:DNA modification methylase